MIIAPNQQAYPYRKKKISTSLLPTTETSRIPDYQSPKQMHYQFPLCQQQEEDYQFWISTNKNKITRRLSILKFPLSSVSCKAATSQQPNKMIITSTLPSKTT